MTADTTTTPPRSHAPSVPHTAPSVPHPAPPETENRVAVIGMAFRLPGADSRAAYWRTVRAGHRHVTRFTAEDFAAAGIRPELSDEPDFVGASALLDGIDRFDASFFSMSGQEAALTDPQQRLFLECCHHALEDAGYAGEQPGLRTGVYASSGYHLFSLKRYLYHNVLGPTAEEGWVPELHRNIGSYTDFAATRAAFRLGLTGPAMGVQTACSSSLVGVHLARQALLAGDTDLALAGATAIHLPQVLGYRHMTGSILSRTGHCRPFDADSDGTVGGNAVAVVVLKRLDRALADGDTVHAVLLGSAVNNDGAEKRHFTEPSVAGQRAVIRDALTVAGVPADSIGYVEAHGTGTYKGDPMEFRALSEVYREQTDRVGFCALGSVKANLGHLDVASGLVGLIKAALVVRHGTIPPLAGLTRPNPLLDLANSPFYLPEAAHRWPAGPGPRRAAVTSLGVGGTNAHAVLEEPPRPESRRPVPVPPRSRSAGSPLPHTGVEPTGGTAPYTGVEPTGGTAPYTGVVPVSARDRAALVAGARRLRTHLARNPAARHDDLVTTLATGRAHLRHRLVLYGRGTRDLARSLDAFLDDTSGTAPARATTGWSEGTVPRTRLAPVAWMFSGQGGIRRGAARELHARFRVVRDTLDRCEEAFRAIDGGSLLDGLLSPAPTGGGTAGEPSPARAYQPAEAAQAALFALQAAQVELWLRITGPPAMVAGHSAGEYAALYAAGGLSLADGIRLTAERGRLMERQCAPGAMLAVFADHATVRGLCDTVDELELAAVNGPHHRVVAGPPAAVELAARRLEREGVRCHRLDVTRAFHSALLDPVLDRIGDLTERTTFTPTTLPFLSALDGVTRPPGWSPDAAYLRAQAREPVRFDRVLEGFTAAGCGPLQELGPGTVLSGMAARAGATALPTLRPGADPRPLWRAAGELYCRGHPLDWRELTGEAAGRRVPLPGYAFQRRTYWTGPELVLPVTAAAPRDPVNEERERTAMQDVEEILARVVTLTAEHLETDPAEIDAEVPFFDLGADSLRMINMLQDLEQQYAVKVSMRELFEEADTPLLVARLVADRGGATRTEEHPPTAAAPEPAPVPEPVPVPAAAPSSVGPSAPSSAAPSAPDPALAGAAPLPSPVDGSPRPADGTPPPGGPLPSGAPTRLPDTEPVAVPPAPPENGGYATQAAVDALAEEVRRLTENQVRLMRQFTQVLDSHLDSQRQER